MRNFEKPEIKKDRFCPRFKGKHFGFFIKSFIMRVLSLWKRRKIEKSDFDSWFCKSNSCSCSINPVITWIGHSSFLIQIGGVNILTDPIFGESLVLYKRFLKAGISFEKLPNIDFVLISHNHPDHMDVKSLMKLKEHNGTYFFVPEGDKLWFDRKSFPRVKEFTWWKNKSFNLRYGSHKVITFTFLPSNHWSQRGLFDKNRSLWGSWMIECDGRKIYFCGDTSYDSHFKEIAQVYPNIDIALMPIGPCEPKKWIAHHHIDARESVQGFIDLNAKNFVPMHWGTFPLGAESFDVPMINLKKNWKEFSQKGLLKDKTLHLIKAGQRLEFSSLISKDDLFIKNSSNSQSEKTV